MGRAKTTRKSVERISAFGLFRSTAGILVAHAPDGANTVDRCAVIAPFTIGRASGNSFVLDDDKISGNHCRIFKDPNGFWLEDLGSTNGTFLGGNPVLGPSKLQESEVIRIGSSVLVFHKTANLLLTPPPLERYGMLGTFHDGPLIQELKEAALSFRHLLLVGPSGAGKELAANTLAAMLGGDAPLKLVAYNAARFTSEEEATTTLFGVGPKVFTNVESRAGLIEHATGGILFLDEIHNLPERVQRSLLRVIEEGVITRIGEVTQREVNVRFVLASNAPPPDYDLASDLLARLRQISIPSVKERVADVPTLFKQLLERTLVRHNLPPDILHPLLGGDHFEALCLDGFERENVRGLMDLTDRLATRIRNGVPIQDAVLTVFSERFHDGAVAARYIDAESDGRRHSNYEQNREIITAVFRECKGNLSATERTLTERGIKCTRRWLGVFAEKWGLRTPRN